jgi:hypothetical protein
MVHIEGMGWLGSALALRLAHDGIPFTWHDTSTPFTAWQASTGIAYPAGDDRSMTNLHLWHTWQSAYPDLAAHTVPTAYCYAHKKPPHNGRYPVTDLGWVRVAGIRAFTVDVPALVPAVRERFATQRLTAAPDGQPVIVAHGYTPRLDHYVWGWAQPVRLDTTAIEALYPLAPGERYAFYGRVHRFQMAYAYPIAGRPGWWRAGSALVVQRDPKPGRAAAHAERWHEGFAKLFPKIPIVDTEPAIQGWRPAGKPDDTGLILPDGPDRIQLPPLWHSGVRWAPELINGAAMWARMHAGVH